MKLTFDVTIVQQLLNNSKNAKQWEVAYGEHGDQSQARPGLWLVGDRGVYLMSNSTDGVHEPGSTPENTKHVVAFAHQCDPDKCEHWYENKRAAFGGDDGVEFLDARLIEAALAKAKKGKMSLNITSTKISA
jgi:hypothetical protein